MYDMNFHSNKRKVISNASTKNVLYAHDYIILDVDIKSINATLICNSTYQTICSAGSVIFCTFSSNQCFGNKRNCCRYVLAINVTSNGMSVLGNHIRNHAKLPARYHDGE